MSLADELLNNLTDEEIAEYTTEDAEQNHIVIGADRFIAVPPELKRIAVQHDENVEVVTFDCPRYWKNLDMSKMKIYVNYMLPSGKLGCYFANNVVIDELDTNIMHFDWNITSNATPEKGTLSFLVCIKKKDAGGKTKNHWNSELNREMYVSAGLECEEAIIAQYPDIITQILEQIDGEVIIANNPAVDKSLTIEGFAADAKATGRAISVERARIDALQAIPEGSTSADAALYDINIGYDGTDWKAPGAAVRGQAAQLANYIDNKTSQLFDEIGDISYQNIDNGKFVYRNPNGTGISDLETFSIIKYDISSFVGNEIRILSYVYDAATFAFTDRVEELIFVGEVSEYTKTAQKYITQTAIPENAYYLYVSCENSYISSVKVHLLNLQNIVSKYARKNVNKTYLSPFKVIENSFIDYKDYITYDFDTFDTLIFDVRAFNGLTIDIQTYVYDVATYTFLNEKGECVYNAGKSGIVAEAEKWVATLTIPNGASFLYLSAFKEKLDDCYVSIHDIVLSIPNIIKHGTIKNYTPKKVCCIGDSITYGYTGWEQPRANPTWCETLQTNIGCEVLNYGVSGSSICANDVDPTFYDRIEQISENPDLIIVFGGVNDYWNKIADSIGSINDTPSNSTNFYSAYKYLIEGLFNKFPNALIGIITPLHAERIESNENGISLNDIVNAELEIAKYYSIPVLDMFNHGNVLPSIPTIKSNYFPDGLHPNQKGIEKYLVPKFEQFVRYLLS